MEARQIVASGNCRSAPPQQEGLRDKRLTLYAALITGPRSSPRRDARRARTRSIWDFIEKNRSECRTGTESKWIARSTPSRPASSSETCEAVISFCKLASMVRRVPHFVSARMTCRSGSPLSGTNHAFAASRPACRASDGVMPKRPRNVRLKCDRSLKPAANAIAAIVLSERCVSNNIS